jgi:diacylglycerol O-acyltransferase
MSLEHERLSAVDAAWYRMDVRGEPADIGCVMVLDGPVDEARVRSALAERLTPHPRFHQRVVDSKHRVMPPWWEDEPSFSFDEHVDTRPLDTPTDAALQSLVTELMNQPLDWSRSPWHLTIIHGLEGGRAAIFSRVHHCMGDGFALLDVLLRLADPDGEPAVPPPAIPRRPGWLAEASRLAHDAAGVTAAAGHLLLAPFDSETPLRGERSGQRLLACSEPVPVARVKGIARACGGTINDVLAAALAGALRRWLVERGAKAERIRAMVPVNLRPPTAPIDDIHGNWFGLVLLDLPTDLADRGARVAAVEREMTRIKSSKEAIVSMGILAALGRSPAVVDHIVDDLFARKASIVITNVAGPRGHLRIAGHRMRDMWFWSPPCGLGCGASILSYAGNVRVGIRADSAIMADPDAVARWFVEELEAVEERTTDPAHARAPRP